LIRAGTNGASVSSASYFTLNSNVRSQRGPAGFSEREHDSHNAADPRLIIKMVKVDRISDVFMMFYIKIIRVIYPLLVEKNVIH